MYQLWLTHKTRQILYRLLLEKNAIKSIPCPIMGTITSGRNKMNCPECCDVDQNTIIMERVWYDKYYCKKCKQTWKILLQ